MTPTALSTLLPTVTPIATQSVPPVYFGTLPPGSVLPSDSDCAARVRFSSWEPRPGNVTANQTVVAAPVITGWTSAVGGYDDRAQNFANRITGNFTGTTDEIIQWGACKWGLDENVDRAQAVVESNWNQAAAGDYTSDASQCGAFGKTAPCYQSYGILQIKATYSPETYPSSLNSTAYNVDYALAEIRVCYEGYVQWGFANYVAGDDTNCRGWYYSGGWKDSGAVSYESAINQVLSTKTWTQPSF